MKRLLLMSSSRRGDMGYLEHAGGQIRLLFQDEIRQVLFIPYAAVACSFDTYEDTVRRVFAALGVEAVSVHRFPNARKALEKAAGLVVGGGNTFALLYRLYGNGLVEAVRERVEAGMPYLGWSAGTNVACPTIRTTNDMPVLWPPSPAAFDLVPFQINPHFIFGKPAGHNGESREERLAEYLAANPGESVLALCEGSALHVEGDTAILLGGVAAPLFRPGGVVETIADNENFRLDRINGPKSGSAPEV